MNHHFSILLVVVVAAILALSENVVGAPIYSQVLPEEPVGAFSSDVSLTGQKIADNFILEGLGTSVVRSLRFLGGYGVNDTPPFTPPLDALPNDSFRVIFLEDMAGSPGGPIEGGDVTITSIYSRTPTGGQLLNALFNPIEYIINFEEEITLSREVVYWISIGNDPGPDHGWAWARANAPLNPLLASTYGDVTTGPWNVGNSSGMWFELNNQNIPEPTSVAMILTAFVPTSLIRKGTLS